MVPLERQAELLLVLSDEAGERHGEVEPQADVATAVILEFIELLVGFVAPLAGEDLKILEGRGVDRTKAVAAIDPPRGLDDPLPRHHRLGEVIAETF